MEPLFKQRRERLDLFRQLRRLTKPKTKVEIPDHLYTACIYCKKTLQQEVLEENNYVCPECGEHLKLTAWQRCKQIVDENSFTQINARVMLKQSSFPGYMDKIAKIQAMTNLDEAVITGIAKIGGVKTALGIMDSHFMMGSMGSVVGEKLTRLIEEATRRKLPLVIFCTSGGARMQEGNLSLFQMAKTSAALLGHSKTGKVFISVLTHPTTGGVSASFAMLGDLILAEPNCLVGFAGRRVIENTMNQKLPDNFQRSEFVLEKGFIDAIVHRNQMKETIGWLLKIHEGKKG